CARLRAHAEAHAAGGHGRGRVRDLADVEAPNPDGDLLARDRGSRRPRPDRVLRPGTGPADDESDRDHHGRDLPATCHPRRAMPPGADVCDARTVPTAHYEIRIRGRLSAPVVSRFAGLTRKAPPVETILEGPIEDQAALYGHLERIQSLGLELVEVRRIADPD